MKKPFIEVSFCNGIFFMSANRKSHANTNEWQCKLLLLLSENLFYNMKDCTQISD